MRILILISLAGLLIGCGYSTKKNSIDKSIQELPDTLRIGSSEMTKQMQNSTSDYLKIIGDSVEIPFFEIELTLSKKAEEKLKADKESVIVSASFEGFLNGSEDIPEKYQDYIEFGKLFLVSHEIELNNERLARFEKIKFPKELYDLLENKDIELLINVFSGRKSSIYNLLDCDILQDSMSNIKGKRFKIKGKLIYNDD
jgi:hypothetical protein